MDGTPETESQELMELPAGQLTRSQEALGRFSALSGGGGVPTCCVGAGSASGDSKRAPNTLVTTKGEKGCALTAEGS